ncbi:dimethylmenaquinone methyltransferase [Carbonactinospora thermoautotrophica]|uniref:Dimethylmenaquinone methyltransferase n=4 Tax=Carbonactinospora thermoautotrophica TaxID=1469144 RepID=A0A132N6H4_9ACTN|nr:FAD linked oxidase domain protein [Carbonactinospora thermoautotrophica]KWX05729.1 dimethylmenaquinone methyltransferase [Carbonactinospora thermoautotrophica]
MVSLTPVNTSDVDVRGLERWLRETIAGTVGFDAGSRALYSMDASNYRRRPLGVVLPRDVDDVVATVAACREFGVPVVPRGGGTSIAGNATGEGVVIDTSRHLTRILQLDPDRRVARVQPGVVLDDLRAAAARYGLTFGPDPSTRSRCTLGGMIGNNACGSHSVAWGTTADNVEELDVLLYDGTRLRVGPVPRAELDRLAARPGRAGQVYAALRDLAYRNLAVIRQELGRFGRQVSGYGLHHLLPEHGHHVARALVGTEGTCVTVLEATVRLVEAPRARALLVLGFADDVAAARAVPELLPLRPLTVEGIDDLLVEALLARGRRPGVALPDGRGWLFVEVGGDSPEEAVDRARQITAALGRQGSALVVSDPAEQRALWRIREEGAGLATRMADGSEAWPGWEDAAVPPERLGDYLRDFKALLARHGRRGVTYGHFGEGCVHVRIDFDLITPAGVAGFRRFLEEAADLVVRYGGSLSGEHGDGQARAELLPRMYSRDVIELFERFKAIWDPDDRMNPGVVVRPHQVDDHLRFAAVGRGPRTVFAYPDDGGDFAAAMRRCVGVGKCRDAHPPGGVMCPSYQVTREEKHSTRGRAHLLYEMLAGDLVTAGWRSPEVREALDLCLACKGCKSDCPVNVDMATYKAEFLHHHYAGRVRPLSHYSMGWLPVWARLASVAPGLVNAVTGRPALARVVKRLGGVAPERDIPRFADQPFTRWFRRRPAPAPAGRTVLLWPDTFTNHLDPGVGRAAVAVLEDAGFRVVLPERPVCCGLTWVSTGQLGIARRVMRRTLDTLGPVLDAGVPVVGLEPSCTALFRSDLPELLPGDARARALAERTYTFAGFLAEHAPDWAPPRLDRPAITQVHCHQHAVLGTAAEEELLRRAGVANQRLDSGCCGLAGDFGFERGHYEVSMALAERVLLPAVRAADPGTLVLADGFSCRTQIAQGAGRRALHLAEALALGLGR